MRRTGRVLFLFLLICSCMMGLWLFQSWREERISKSEMTLSNIYITSVSGSTVQIISDNREKSYDTMSAVSGQAILGVADLLLRHNKIVKIKKKPEEISGKLLKMTETAVTIEDYGEVPLDKNFVVYEVGADKSVKEGDKTDLVIGATDIRFIAAEGKICAAVLREDVPEKIRVLLKGKNGTSYDVKKVAVTSNQNYRILCNKETTYHEKGEVVTFTAKEWKGICVITAEDGGRITLTNFKRRQGVPSYRGSIEIDQQGKYLNVINEVSLEEYLYSVVPSEMPTEYSDEALRAQAICARTYAVGQIQSHRLASLGAHVDDSVSYQVYNDLAEDERAIRAVNDTRGQIVTYQDKIASTYFYSTSCGSAEGTRDVWYTEKDQEYLPCLLLNEKRDKKDLAQEKAFREFIQNPPETLDSKEGWYRWETELSKDELQKSLEQSILEREKVNPTQVQVRDESGNYLSREISGVGEIQNIEVKKRGSGGVVTMVEIQGSEAVIRVYTEYNIRTLLSGTQAKFSRKDKKEVTGLSILPSGYFYIEKKENSYVFHGGGYGHGVGMSQTGADVLAKQGKKATEIIDYFFPKTKVKALADGGWNG